MRERQRVEIVSDLLAAQGFLSIADLMAATGLSTASARRDAGRSPSIPRRVRRRRRERSAGD
jgi:hypothetical protein